MDPKLRSLLHTYASDLMDGIDTLTHLSDRHFEQGLYPLWVQVDQQIPGPGLQYAYWMQGELRDYPFSYEFERVLRPLRYVVYHLHDIGTPYMSTREIVFAIGCHLEGCVKDLCEVTKFSQPESFRTGWGRRSLGQLVKKRQLRKCLGEDLCCAITSFCDLAWNRAKHDYCNRGSPDPMIPFADAVASYFLARALGAEVLRASGRLEHVIQAIRNERARLEDQID